MPKKTKDQIEREYFLEIQDIDSRLKKITNKFSGVFPKPINISEEREKFFKKYDKNEEYNPQLIYEKKNYDLKILDELKNFKINLKGDIYGFKKLYLEKIKFKKYQFLAFYNWGKPISTKFAKKYWGKPSYFDFRRARKFAKNFKRETVKFTKITSEELAQELKAEVKKLTNENLQVEFVVLTNKINIISSKLKIQINPLERYTSLDLKRLKVHEIGVHHMRSYNGRKLNIGILSTGTANYTKTEEGLAAYTEEIKGVVSKAQLYIYAGRVIATYLADKKSFYEIFKYLKKLNFKNSDAFTITLRAKRNICDTSQLGGFTKDYVYFSGYLDVKKFAKKNDIKKLFIGKITIENYKYNKNLRKFIKKNYNSIETIFDDN